MKSGLSAASGEEYPPSMLMDEVFVRLLPQCFCRPSLSPSSQACLGHGAWGARNRRFSDWYHSSAQHRLARRLLALIHSFFFRGRNTEQILELIYPCNLYYPFEFLKMTPYVCRVIDVTCPIMSRLLSSYLFRTRASPGSPPIPLKKCQSSSPLDVLSHFIHFPAVCKADRTQVIAGAIFKKLECKLRKTAVSQMFE